MDKRITGKNEKNKNDMDDLGLSEEIEADYMEYCSEEHPEEETESDLIQQDSDSFERFDKDSFYSTEPYEFLYAYRADIATHSFLREKMADFAKSIGVRSFKKLYENYIKSLNQNAFISSRVSDFYRAAFEIETGLWVANESGIHRLRSI